MKPRAFCKTYSQCARIALVSLAALVPAIGLVAGCTTSAKGAQTGARSDWFDLLRAGKSPEGTDLESADPSVVGAGGDLGMIGATRAYRSSKGVANWVAVGLYGEDPWIIELRGGDPKGASAMSCLNALGIDTTGARESFAADLPNPVRITQLSGLPSGWQVICQQKNQFLFVSPLLSEFLSVDSQGSVPSAKWPTSSDPAKWLGVTPREFSDAIGKPSHMKFFPTMKNRPTGKDFGYGERAIAFVYQLSSSPFNSCTVAYTIPKSRDAEEARKDLESQRPFEIVFKFDRDKLEFVQHNRTGSVRFVPREADVKKACELLGLDGRRLTMVSDGAVNLYRVEGIPGLGDWHVRADLSTLFFTSTK